MQWVQGWRLVALYTVAIVSAVTQGEAHTAVRARVFWSGPCGDQQQVAQALQERGITLVSTLATDDPMAALELTMSVTERHDALAPADSAESADVLAELQLQDAAGLREQRSIQAASCGVLHSALAIILASFAQRSDRDTDAGAVSHVEKGLASEPDPPRVGGVSVQPLTPLLGSMSSRITLSRKHFEAAAARDTHRRSRELQPGLSALSGVGWTGEVAFGAAAEVEWAPVATWPLALAASAAFLRTPSHDDAATHVTWQRSLGRVLVLFDTPLQPLQLSLGSEFGNTVATRREGTASGSVRAMWYAFTAMPRLRVPLVSRWLHLNFSTGIAVSPVRYALRYTDTGREFLRTSQLEWRAELGFSMDASLIQ